MNNIKPYKNQKNKWIIRYDTKDPATGERVQHSVVFNGTKTQAKNRLIDIKSKINRGEYTDLSSITLKEYLESWKETHCVPSKLQYKTRKSYSAIIDNYLIPHLGRLTLDKLKAVNITNYYNKMLAPKNEGGAGLASTSVLYHHRILRQALRHAVNQDYIHTNPADKVQPPRKARAELIVLSLDQAKYIIANYKEHRIYIPIYLALITGMRRGEIAALRWQNIDLENKMISVNSALQRQNGELVIKETKTNKSRRVLPIPQHAVDELLAVKQQQALNRDNFGEVYDKRGFVCAWEDGKPYDPDWIGRQWASLVKKDGKIPDGVRFHDLRHTHATLLLSQNVNLKVIQERLGHESIATTGDIYSHVTPGIQKEAADILESILEEEEDNQEEE